MALVEERADVTREMKQAGSLRYFSKTVSVIGWPMPRYRSGGKGIAKSGEACRSQTLRR